VIRGFSDVKKGFDVEADVVVVGSGAGGATAASNLAASGMRTVVLEAGPQLQAEDMTRDAPMFLARYFWEGGLRMIGGTTQSPSMMGRCLGGSTVMNSAIMMRAPPWVREIWALETGMPFFTGRELDAAYDRVFQRLGVAPTPWTVMGKRNLLVRDALERAGIPGNPLPRAVKNCEGCADCLTGCAGGAKQSVDRSLLPQAVEDGAEVYTCAQVERVLTQGTRAVGVTGHVVDPQTYEKVGKFTVRAPRVVLAAGPGHTPVILLRSGIDARGTVGSTLFAHIGGGMVGVMDEVVDPWIGATQGWGAISDEIRGLKYEGLWAPPSVLMVRWGDVGMPFMERLYEVKHATVIACIYRGNVRGRVKAKRDGMPDMKLWIPDEEAIPVLRGVKRGADALLAVGAKYVHTAIPGCVDEMRSTKDTETLLDPRLRARDLQMTMNHVMGSCRMTAFEDGPVDPQGRVRGVDNLWICDASVIPSPSAVNPQATIMALSDITSRRIGEVVSLRGRVS
jgi:choline dehydrogenase-like flavoprotein